MAETGKAMTIITTVHVREITTVATDRICVAIRDGNVPKYAPVVNPSGAQTAAYRSDTTAVNPATGLTEACKIVGRLKDYLKFYDGEPVNYADLAALDNPANYPTFGGRTVTAVYRLTLPYEESNWANNVNQSIMEHKVYLQLDGALPNGSYTMSITGNTFPSTPFVFDDKYTRCSAIGATHLGHRPGDGSKVAYLASWIPGGSTEGAVDFANDYNITEFHLINTKQQVVFTGSVVQVCSPTLSETGYTNDYFPSISIAPKTATAVNTATETITVPSHGYSTGQYKHFRGFAGTSLEGANFQITVVDANNFTVSPAITGTWTANTYISAHDGKVYDTVLRNRYGTYVYTLDYSAFVPTDPAERYKVYIPGFGVSDEFVMHEAVWRTFARNAFKGIYNQCIGIPLEASVGGWERPVWGRDGVNSCEIYESMLPGDMHYENAVASPLPTSLGTYSAYITTTRVTGFRSGMADAGDHDWHVQRHFPDLWTLVDIAYERLSSPARDTNFGFPKASDTFGDYTSMYDDIDAMPDVIHMALHFCEGLRNTQAVDGRVYSGMNYKNPLYPGQADADISDGAASNNWDPSWMAGYQPHLLAADHLSNFAYAAMAAKLGKIFTLAGHTTLGQTWTASAELAYQWADDIYQGYAVSGIASAAWIAHYITRLNFKVRSGFTDPQLTTHYDALQTLCTEMRMFAVYQLYTAFAAQSPDTGSAPYFAIISPLGNTVNQTGYNGALGVWEYSKGPTGNTSDKDYYLSRMWIQPENFIYTPALTGNRVYKYSGSGNTPKPSGPNNNLIYAFLASDVRSAGALPKDNTNKFLKLVQAGECYNTGANPYDCSCVTGIGPETRQPHSLFIDRFATGLAAHEVPGFPCYMGTESWATASIGAGLSTESPLNYTISRRTAGDPFASTNGSKKLVEPYHLTIPFGVVHYRNRRGIYTSETDLGGPIFGRFAQAMFLHGWDGNDNTEEPKTRFWARCV